MNNHIDLFPRIPSHWCRKDTSKEYLEAHLNKEIMYRLYVEYCQEKQSKPVSKTVYKEAIIKKNIGFYHPRKDQCWCYNYKENNDEGKSTAKTKEEYELHIRRKNAADEQKKTDKKVAQEDKSIICANFDLEAVLNCPIFFAKPVFYKRKLAVFNLTVYEVASKQGYAFLWDETNGHRGSNEIATCVFKFISSLPRETKQLRLYSDLCPGQNKNAIIACMLQYSLSKHDGLEIIQMNFLEPGHTHMECDSMHSTIEKASEYAKIYVPNDWENVLRLAKKKGSPYKVNRITYKEFLNFKSYKELKMPNVHKATDLTNLNWKNVKCLLFKKETPNLMFVKCEYWDEFKEIQTNLRRGRKSSTASTLGPQTIYTSKIPINQKKYKDLMELCKSDVIKEEYHDFYENLPVSHNDEDDDESSDDEISLQAMREKMLSKRRK
ncbi:hypothetical protein RI129_008575 [Pyrocoelia pectoralis]|uniref:DUF7869 domain-containing protein n=1 Tax=Pyrocoelia pectoralis TaxID=417401 RepID=A0AAN7VBJ1_9COLE